MQSVITYVHFSQPPQPYDLKIKHYSPILELHNAVDNWK